MFASQPRRFLRYFDWISFILTVTLLSLGLMFVFSATYTPEIPFSSFFKRQLFGAITGLLLYATVCSIDPRILSAFGFLGYNLALILLLYTLARGSLVLGARRWISLVFFKFQPSELAKLFFPFFFGYLLSARSYAARTSLTPRRISSFLPSLAMLFLGFFLILKQPDLGTAIILLLIGLTLLWIAGIPKRVFLLMGLFLCATGPVAWKSLKPYQQARIQVLLGQGTAHKDRYQLEQAKIAVGSGGLTGKGFLKGTQNKHSFLPEDHNDFIFAVICEEFGFVGAIAVLLLFGLLCARLIALSFTLKDLRKQIIVLGITLHIAFSILINTGMVVGLLPIVGIPLPLFSYGVTHLWTTLAGLGVAHGIAIRRFYH